MLFAFPLLLTLAGCRAEPPDDTGIGEVLVDADGDGYLASVDCDDSDAEVHPGADEVWYDGVDQDCDGQDDDQDGDGFALAEDCDDEDASVFPGAGEVFDDGIDQDCDGQDSVSPADGDGDGYPDTIDCDDEDPDVHPGAVDDTEDGVDQDCDGLDGGSTAVDADGDGYTESVDCDDSDPDVNPGADDPQGDGIDQDCDGVDGNATSSDQDADGWASEAYGGTDCDDTDPDIYPGADEVAGDDIDSDCDGADFGVDGLVVGDLVITEIMYDSFDVADADGEWFEVYNATGHTVNLLGLVVADDGAYATEDIFTVDEDVVANVGARLVFAVNDDPSKNGGITADFDYPGGGVNLNNSGDDLYLGVSTGGSTTTIDSVSYDEASGWPSAKGASIELNDNAISASSNDTAGNWCKATSTAGTTTDLGSPGDSSSGC